MSDAETKGRGRPSDYRDEFPEQAEKLARLGATMAEIADFFGKSEATIYAWQATHAEFSEALKRGRIPADAEVASSLYTRANWHEYTEQQAIKVREIVYGDNGKKLKEVERVEVVDVKRVLPPSDTAMIFWLKNRRSQDWRDKRDVEVEHVNVTHEERVKRREEVLARRRAERDNGRQPDDRVH